MKLMMLKMFESRLKEQPFAEMRIDLCRTMTKKPTELGNGAELFSGRVCWVQLLRRVFSMLGRVSHTPIALHKRQSSVALLSTT